jgi:hypothetical protein
VHLDDRVVQVDDRGRAGIVDLGEQRGPLGRPGQQPRRHRVELADMPVGERAQRTTPASTARTPARTSDPSRGAAATPCRRRCPRRRPSRRLATRPSTRRSRPCPSAPPAAHQRACPTPTPPARAPGPARRRHQIRLINITRRRAQRMRQLHLRDALRARRSGPWTSRILQACKGHPPVTARSPAHGYRWIGAKLGLATNRTGRGWSHPAGASSRRTAQWHSGSWSRQSGGTP